MKKIYDDFLTENFSVQVAIFCILCIAGQIVQCNRNNERHNRHSAQIRECCIRVVHYTLEIYFPKEQYNDEKKKIVTDSEFV